MITIIAITIIAITITISLFVINIIFIIIILKHTLYQCAWNPPTMGLRGLSACRLHHQTNWMEPLRIGTES